MAEYNSVNLGRIMPKYTGDYSTNVNYNTLDIVFYEGSSYIATQPSLRQTPAIDSEYWGLISGKGDKGDKGDIGPTGPKGNKGDKGDPGKDAEMPVIGGRNLLLGSQLLTINKSPNAGVNIEVVPYDSKTNMWHITAPSGGSINAGIYISQPNNVSDLIVKGQQWAFSFDIKGTGDHSQFGIEGSTPFNKISGNVPTDWTRVHSTGIAAGTKNTVIIYFNNAEVALDVYIKFPKLERGNVPTDWTPAPEDVPSNDAQLVHKTGKEVLAGDKTFTSSVEFSNPIRGGLESRTANFTDLATVAADMQRYAGIWWFYQGTLLNSPIPNYAIIEVFKGSSKSNGYIRVTGTNTNTSYYTIVNPNIIGWNKIAEDTNVVHNTGNETIAGDKTFTGNTNLATTTILAGNYGLRVTSSGFQKTTDGKTWVSANI